MSLSMRLTRSLLRFRPVSTKSADSIRRRAEHRKPSAPVSPGIRRVADVDETVVNGCPVIHLTPKSGAGSSHLVYLYGGAYVLPMLPVHWTIISTLIRQSGVSVTVPQYGLAPEHTVDEAYALLDAVYDGLIARPGMRVFLSGDSSGGALALGQAIRLRDAGRLSPAGVILISPWLDATMSNPKVTALEPRDRMLGRAGLVEAGRWWAGPHDPRSPLVSPILDSLANLPPVHTYQGAWDLFAADAEEMTDKIRSAGGDAELHLYPDAFHVFVGAPWTSEARAALRDIASLLRA
ncbi:MAG TPA: alpha/beta hydrolase [Actinopolymorphaceae bacterium]|jgi:RND superfamily putative drug exporter